ncbi:MAG: transglycosylase SLT domain-containing protein [Succinatimonas sp.]|nr:transglycosylase SLT domain-containing protein [Succinatimonas sp.]
MLYNKLFDITAILIFLMALSYHFYHEDMNHHYDVSASDKVIVEKAIVPEYKTVAYYDVPLNEELQDFIRIQCNDAGVDFELVLAVMQVESDFQYDVVSPTHDHGIMQINETNHQELKNKLNITDFLDPYDCTTAGIYMLSSYRWCENETQMLMCYNMGVAGAKNAWNQGIYETDYTKKVLEAKKEIGGKKYEVKIFCDQDIKQ